MTDEVTKAFTLTGRNALIVGAAGGVGEATARLFAAQGARLTLADRAAPETLAAALRKEGAVANARDCDLARRADAEATARDGGPWDAVVVTAAICPWDDWEDPAWDAAYATVMAVNLKGAIDLCRVAVPAMRARGGTVVLVASLAGRTGGLIASPHYVASKGGLIAFARWLARREAGAGIRVNVVAPASIDTPMMAGQPVDRTAIPLGRMATAEEVAGPIAFLCAPASGYITGTVIDVNGGLFGA